MLGTMVAPGERPVKAEGGRRKAEGMLRYKSLDDSRLNHAVKSMNGGGKLKSNIRHPVKRLRIALSPTGDGVSRKTSRELATA